MRIGHGYDVHKFGSDKPLILGGIHVPYEQGVLAHSDGDVVLHAVTDAVLGALALGDIGHHFPDTDEAFAGADSAGLLSQVVEKANLMGYRLGNLDVTVVAQAPRLAEHIPAMQERIAKLFSVAQNCINVKATTTEKLGFVGRKEGIACHAVVLMKETTHDQ
ncbi:2-C-methyl-D-erythritol 2,4-cyclodiphosphate synthase [Pseudidiomarina terrestris]|uniref:2-C-methyl-D-erythritol 2,4-cyclodiphosphate synthase n=1 Tax=Pseudidiomarina terrestris TaxID=2820060 RepID=A0AAW7QUM6_9GAMM|nr:MULTISPECIES: 2-C-methyl-D-erythritol 2,4-cyclodiphosphate synthase [unclassified Pseudidiomarina]MDN7123598.1 2-C-methyl-D-erythritol 2,4-cyclodiphosphate synthase [Pseudidiomarina sp. 1APP75-32.1]MDN7126612.1 2-C-methyl-D-erythritol 2,4-cyclodiphosphate synthase [Pseudidiomarina sp. 1APR75-33.1]MDN7128678.1 2-C-methyl-D-erythritol 2,4-cyclodiphosphate synthase [Pseudidiomarina sp. 1APR75-15]MDN7135063.1 2-C-methyl-D-erythritol 2,4-cyclodiphosphate synthase [Pseudidiomarina sp. 1ASP75-5]MD